MNKAEGGLGGQSWEGGREMAMYDVDLAQVFGASPEHLWHVCVCGGGDVGVYKTFDFVLLTCH